MLLGKFKDDSLQGSTLCFHKERLPDFLSRSERTYLIVEMKEKNYMWWAQPPSSLFPLPS
jgi:hypothetical protein